MLRAVITDLAEIAERGMAKSAENTQFRRYLAAHHQRLEAFQAAATEVQRRVDCSACASCCRHSIVSVRAAEVARIAAFLRQNEEVVVHRFTTPDAESPRARTLAAGKDGCVFPKDNRCGIYPARPEA